jgi:hypothetical protein
MRRSTVLSLSLQLVFPAFSFRANSIKVFLAISLLFGVLSWTFLELWIKIFTVMKRGSLPLQPVKLVAVKVLKNRPVPLFKIVFQFFTEKLLARLHASPISQ